MARNQASSQAHSFLNTFIELLHKHPLNLAVANFSRHIGNNELDVISTNALYFISHPPGHNELAKELLERTRQTKRRIDFCTSQMADVAKQKLSNKSIVVHPVGMLTAPLLKSAGKINYISADNSALKILPEADLSEHTAFSAPEAIENADLVILEPAAITKNGAVVEKGARLLAELACARNIPVYAIATSWHTVPKWQKAGAEEVPAGLLTGVMSDRGIHAHAEFLSRVQKDYPWII
jgi:translation initiation factor 2B subunit (eIF-2B alpha/beta/delta family)